MNATVLAEIRAASDRQHASASAGSETAQALRALVAQGEDRLPRPGAGQTWRRWQQLAAIAGRDLSLSKLFEGHTDALAILDELGASQHHRQGLLWGVWASEAPSARVRIHRRSDGQTVVSGRKAWCSGVAHVDRGLLTAWDDDATVPQLVAIAMDDDGIGIDTTPWQAVGMAASASGDLLLDAVPAQRIGGPGDYLQRAGFWHGGAGIAACWWGATAALARAAATPTLKKLAQGADLTDVNSTTLAAAAIGRLDVSLSTTRALLVEAAGWIDANPRDDARQVALRCRLAAETSAELVLREATRLAGAGPYCRDRWFAVMAADLPVFIRQSHGDRDLASLARSLSTDSLWAL